MKHNLTKHNNAFNVYNSILRTVVTTDISNAFI